MSVSQGAVKSQPPEVGIQPGPQDLKANTLPRRCKSRLLPQGSRSELYTYTYYIFPCFKLIRPRSTRNHAVIPGHFILSDARNPSRGPPTLATKCHRVQKNPNRPRWESNLGRRIYRQTLYHVAVKAGCYRKAVEVSYIPIPTTSEGKLLCLTFILFNFLSNTNFASTQVVVKKRETNFRE